MDWPPHKVDNPLRIWPGPFASVWVMQEQAPAGHTHPHCKGCDSYLHLYPGAWRCPNGCYDGMPTAPDYQI
jgi:hypothetical protein